MNYLLDTHVIIWFIEGDAKFPPKVRSTIEDTANKLYLSIVSLWEIVIKSDAGKLNLKLPISEIMIYLADNQISILNFTIADFETQLKLPLHHKDPFDRLIIAQAINNGLTTISSDRHFAAYPLTLFSW